MSLEARRWAVLASAVVSFFAVGLTFFAVPPLVPQLVARFGLSNLQIGVLMGAISVPAILLSIPLGAAVDRWPARSAGLGGLAVMAAGAALFAVGTSYATLLAGRLLFGLGGLVMNLLLARLISRAFAGRELSLAMGIFNAVYPASMIAMYSLHPVLERHLGWRGELGLLAGTVLLALPLHALAVPREPAGTADGRGRRPSRPTLDLWRLALSWMLFFAAFASVFTFAPGWAGEGAAALLTVTAINWVALFLNPLVGKAIDRTGRPGRWATLGQLGLAAVLAGMAAGVLSPLPAMLLTGLAASLVPTAIYSLPARLVPSAHLGFAFGFITAFSNLGTLAGPAAAGAIRDAIPSWTPVWLLLAGTALAGALVTPRRSPREREGAPAVPGIDS